MDAWSFERMGLTAALLAFCLSALVVVVAGARLAREGDVIAARTRLGGIWFGTVFLALATSLPELMTTTAAGLLEAVDLAAGNLFGSSMANMLILALLTLLPAGGRFVGRATLDQVMSASLAITLNCLAGAFVLARLGGSLGGVGAGSLVLLAAYLVGTRLLYRHTSLARAITSVAETENPADTADAAEAWYREEGQALVQSEPRLRPAIVAFVLAALVVAASAPVFAASADRIADLTGLGETVVGTWGVGLATSLPELVTSLAAVRIGAFDLAIGNLFGSNAMNMLMFVPLDLAHRAEPVFTMLSPAHAVTALVATAMMGLALISLIYHARRRFSMLEASGLVMVLVYLLGIFLVRSAG